MIDRIRIVRGGFGARRLMQALADSPLPTDEWMQQQTRLLSKNTQRQAGLLQLDEEFCFLKFYRYCSPLQKVQFAIGRGRPLRGFKAARLLRREGVAVPKPRGCLIVPDGILLLVEGIACEGNLRQVWNRQPEPDEIGPMMEVTAQAIAQMHLSGFAHGDCKWSNILWEGRTACLVGLDDVTRCSPNGGKTARDLAQFTINAEEMEMGTEFFDLFLHTYLQAMGETRQAVVERVVPHLYRFRAKLLAGYGPRSQRLL